MPRETKLNLFFFGHWYGGNRGQGTRLNSVANFTLQSPAPCQGAISFGTVIQKKIQKRETTLKPQTRQQPSRFQVYLVITLFRRKLVKRGKQKQHRVVLLPTSPHGSTELSSIQSHCDLLQKNHGGGLGMQPDEQRVHLVFLKASSTVKPSLVV